MQRLPICFRPGDGALVVDRIRVDADDHLSPVSIPEAEGGIVFTDALGRTADRIQMHGRAGAVFAAVDDLFKTYVDFRFDIESRLLTLWTLGTHFCTMFPAYPYLALNGLKNSGKRTVMRVL